MAVCDHTPTRPENNAKQDTPAGQTWPFIDRSEAVETTSWDISQCARLLDEQLDSAPSGADLTLGQRGHLARTHYLIERLVAHAKELETQLYGEPRKEVWL